MTLCEENCYFLSLSGGAVSKSGFTNRGTHSNSQHFTALVTGINPLSHKELSAVLGGLLTGYNTNTNIFKIYIISHKKLRGLQEIPLDRSIQTRYLLKTVIGLYLLAEGLIRVPHTLVDPFFVESDGVPWH